jgi:phage baseplate assembly protein W
MPGDINFKFPLKKVTRGFPEGHRTTEAAIKEDLKLLILTKKGERVMDPDLGTNISNIYGELFNNTDKVGMQKVFEREITSAAEKYMPSIKITAVTVKDFEDDPSIDFNQIVVGVNYSHVSNQGFNDTLTFRIGQ